MMNKNIKIAKELVRIAKMLVSSAGDDIESMSVDEKINLAKNNASPEILEKLAEDKNDDVRWAVAENTKTPVDILRKLAEDKNDYVKSAVVDNPNAPVEVLENWAEDKDCYKRQAVAHNPNTPTEVLKKLAGDEDERIRRIAERALRKRGQ